MRELGILEEGVSTADRLWFLPRASMLAPGARIASGRKMEIYASMVEYMDDQIGRVFDYLKEIGEYDNTVVVFFSDNGAEGADLAAMFSGMGGSMGFLHAGANFAESGHNSLGRKGTFAEYGPLWAQVGAAPFRLYKGYVTEGGTRSPLIVSGPGVQGAGALNTTAIMHVMDLAPTLLELAGVEHPATFQGRDIVPMQGKSWVSTLNGEAQSPRGPDEWLGWELFGNRAIRQGDWKIGWHLEPFGTGDWRLFNLDADPGEQFDLSEKFPEKRAELIALWDEYEEMNGVIIGNRSLLEGAKKQLPNPVFESDSYPPIRGIEEIPHKKLIELINQQ
jgi:arylsulfatase